MRANKVRNLLLIAVTGTALTLAGCGGRSVSSVDENDSTISSIASAVSEDTTSADTLNGSGVIAAQEIDPSAVTPSVSEASSTPSDTSSESTSSSSSSTESTTESSTGYTTAGVNMRSDADQDSDVVNTIESGEEVTVLGETNGWTHVRYDGEEGYVKSTYISSTRQSSYDDDDDDDSYYSSDDDDSSDEDEDGSYSSDDDEEESSDNDEESND